MLVSWSELVAGGYNYIYSRRGHGDPSLGVPIRQQPIPADLGFPIAIVAMLVGSLLLLLRAIGSRLKVWLHLLVGIEGCSN